MTRPTSWLLSGALALAIFGTARAQAPAAAPAPQAEAKAEAKAPKKAKPAPKTEPADRDDDEDSGGGRKSRREIVQFGRPVTIGPGESAEQVVVIGAPAVIQGSVEDEVVVIGGPLEVSGTIGGDAVAVGGPLHLWPTAVVEGDAVSVGGQVVAEPGAKIEGDTKSVNIPLALPELGWLRDWFVSGLLLGRPLPHHARWAWLLAAAMLMVYVLVAAAFPRVVERCTAALEARPATALGVGLLGGALAAPVALLLTVSVIGIAAVPLLLCAGIAGIIVGKAAVYRVAGSRIGGPLGLGAPAFAPLAVALGGAAFTVLHAVPFVGFVTWGIAAALGLGAALLTLVESFRGETGAAGGMLAQAAPAGAVAMGTPGAPEAQAAPAAPAAAVAGEAPAAQAALPAPAAADRVDWARLPRASFWERFGAIAIDAVLFVVLAGILPIVTANLFAWAAFQIGMWTWRGTTIGGIVFGLKGVRLDGGKMDFGVAVVRHLASYLSALAGFLGFLWAGWDPEQQTWHDKIAGTIVVKAPKTEPLI